MIKKKIVLILGAGHEQLPLYNICKKENLKIIGIDKNRKAPGLIKSDYKIITSIRNDKKLISKIKNLKLKISAVITAANDIPLIYYKICKSLKVKNISKKSAVLSSDKFKLYNEMKNKNILVPDFLKIKSFKELKNKMGLFSNYQKQFILKPSDGRGSRGVRILSNDKTLKSNFNDCIRNSKNNFIIMQQLIRGTQISSESMIINKKIYTINSFRNYNDTKNLYPYIIENGGDIPLNISAFIEKKIKVLIKNIANVLEINNGPLKCDLILKNNRIFLLEATPRFGGGFLASHTSMEAYGVNFFYLQLKNLLGEKIGKINFKFKKRYLSLRFIFSNKKGKIKSIKKYSQKKYEKYVLHEVIYKKKNEKLKKIQSHADRIGCILVSSLSKKKSVKIAEKLSKSYKIKTYE